MVASCTLNRLEEPSASGSEGTQVTLTAFAADSDAGSKAMLVDGAPDIFWSPGEEIMVFNRSWGTTMFRATNTEPAQVVGFSGSVSGYAGAVGPENQVWAAYPASWDHVWFDYEGGKYVEMVLPFTQAPVAGSFDPSALLMTARAADTNLAFYHVGGGLKFKLTQDWVQQVELRANDKTPLAGYVQVVMDEQGHPVVSEYYETVNAVQMTAPRGERLQPGVWYYLCCLPGVLEQGYTLTFRSEDKTGVSVHADPVEVKRATWGVLEAADAGVVPEDAENDLYGDIIYYTSVDGKIIEPNNVWGFGANILSNTYENGQGVIRFDGPVTGIPNSSFSSRQTLNSIKLPATVWEISGWAFSGCNSLESIVLPEGLVSIQDYAFQGCGFTEIEISGSLQSVSPYAFSNSNNLSTFHGPLATADGRGLVINGILVAFASGGSEEEFDYEVEPGIKGLADRVFSNVWQLRDVTLPESLETIGENAFYWCNGLRTFKGKYASEGGHLLVKDGQIIAAALKNVSELVIPGTVRSIAPDVFASKVSLEKITISEGVEEIGNQAFAYCNRITDITLPESLTRIGDRVFQYCNNIKAFHGKYAVENGKFLVADGILKAFAPFNMNIVSVPEGVTAIGPSVFHNTSISGVNLPVGLTAIEERAFMYCRNLTGIALPATLQTIGTEAFYGCDNEEFTSFTVPAGVTYVGHSIIGYCNSLTSVTLLPVNPPSLDPGWQPLGQIKNNVPVFVPEESLEAYRNSDGWRYQSNYQAIPEYPSGTNEPMHDNDWD